MLVYAYSKTLVIMFAYIWHLDHHLCFIIFF